MYLYYNTLFEKKQPFFVRKFKFLIHFSSFRYNLLIFAQRKVSIFVNFSLPLVVDKNRHTRCRLQLGVRNEELGVKGGLRPHPIDNKRGSVSLQRVVMFLIQKIVIPIQNAQRFPKLITPNSSLLTKKLPHGSFLKPSKSVSRVLYWAVIYLGCALPRQLGATSTGLPSRHIVPPRCCFG